MRVLVACEESQRVCRAFRYRGHEAFSCDLLPCSGGHPEWHIQDNVLNVILDDWDLIIAHPPCTRLCNSGQRWTRYPGKSYDQDFAVWFFMVFTNLPCPRVCIENPIGIMSNIYRKPDQIYNPYDFYPDTEAKATCLWLKNLPPLMPTQVLDNSLITHDIWRSRYLGRSISFNSPDCSRMRSRTPVGVALSMADQWGNF